MEILCALFSGLEGGAASVDAAIAAFGARPDGVDRMLPRTAKTMASSPRRQTTFLRRASRRRERREAMRRKQPREGTRVPPPRQRDVLRAVMLCGPQHGSWMTLRELARVTNYSEASISAQLRHLRKPEYGGFVVEKRCRR